jgi:hypothetical protein
VEECLFLLVFGNIADALISQQRAVHLLELCAFLSETHVFFVLGVGHVEAITAAGASAKTTVHDVFVKLVDVLCVFLLRLVTVMVLETN